MINLYNYYSDSSELKYVNDLKTYYTLYAVINRNYFQLEGEYSFKEFEEDTKVPFAAYQFANSVIKGRVPPLEHIIGKEARAAFFYTTIILGKRFPEGEAAIATNRKLADQYNERFGTNL